MTKRPLILITNDDGIYAPGIKHLWSALDEIADTAIVAPSQEQSGVGLAITTRSPLQIKEVDWPSDNIKAYSVSGTPADCVKIAIKAILKRKPTLIVSGINRGSNAGRNVLYSGTVGGVIEGVHQDVPGIAFSCWDLTHPNYVQAEAYVPYIVNYILEHPLPEGTFLNVNFPCKQWETIQGCKLTRQGKEFWGDDLNERHHPVDKHSYFWLGAKRIQYDEHKESDIHWLQQGYATAVPVHVGELTDYTYLDEKKSLFDTEKK